MEPEKDIFQQWTEEQEKKPLLVRKLRWIPLWWNNTGKYYNKIFMTGVRNLVYWFPIIWKDRHWDSHYIFEIMSHKIKAQSKYIKARNNHTRAKRDAEIMMLCVRLIKLVQDDFYSSEYYDYHKTKHWFKDVPGKEDYSSWESRLLEENFDDFFKKYPLIYKRVLNGEGYFSKGDNGGNKESIAMDIGRINHERASRLLFKIMEHNIEKWWD